MTARDEELEAEGGEHGEEEDEEVGEGEAPSSGDGEEASGGPRRIRLIRKVQPRKKRKVTLRRRREDEVAEQGGEGEEARGEGSVDDDDHVVYDESFEAAFEGGDVVDVEGLGRLTRLLAVELVPAIARKIIHAGGQTLTEDLLRKTIVETPLPKDVAGFLAGQAESVRKEFYRIVAREVATFLRSINLSRELQKILTSLSFEIKTEIRFIPNDQAVRDDGSPAPVKPDVQSRVRVKRDRAESEEGEGRRGRLFRWRERRKAADAEPEGEGEDH